jgi:putative glycosyltransferase (TIGR04348 family)
VRIALITPAKPRSRSGNRNTAQRWAKFLRELGHRVDIDIEWNGAPADLMLALHARKSHDSLARFATNQPQRPRILALTGTDLYRDIRVDAAARESMQLAHRMIVLQERGLEELPPALVSKTRVVYQSAQAIARRPPLARCFEVVVVGHLREEKDPFRAALALHYLPADSRVEVVHLGLALSQDMAREARRIMTREPRYRWLGEVPHWKVRQYLARARLLVVSSRMEGGANVVSEALAAGLPVIASRVPGNVGMLGEDYAGYYKLEDERALAKLLARAERDEDFCRLLRAQCRARARMMTPAEEKGTLGAVVREAARGSRSTRALASPSAIVRSLFTRHRL